MPYPRTHPTRLDGPDAEIDQVLRLLGFTGHESRARAVLETAGLTNPRKSRISMNKLGAVERVLRGAFALSCTDERCEAATRTARPLAVILAASAPSLCNRCAGSANERGARGFLDSCAKAGIRRVVVVGGSPATRTDLESAISAKLEMRLVDGTSKRTLDQARADMEWADIVLIWGNTQLDHKVSTLYTGASSHRSKLVGTGRRGVAALLDAGAEHCRRSLSVSLP